jgi:hypothetical protein
MITGFFAFYTLLLSSASKNRRYVAVLIFGLYLFSDILFAIFWNGISRSPYSSLLSLRSNIQMAGAFIFNQKLPYDIPWFYPFLVLFGVCVLSAIVLRNKVKGVEIVK